MHYKQQAFSARIGGYFCYSFYGVIGFHLILCFHVIYRKGLFMWHQTGHESTLCHFTLSLWWVNGEPYRPFKHFPSVLSASFLGQMFFFTPTTWTMLKTEVLIHTLTLGWCIWHICIQLFRESLSRIKCTRQSWKVIWEMINTLFLTTVACEPPTFVTFLQHLQT